MVTPKEVGWGSYKSYEGPIWLGRDTPYKMPDAPTSAEKVMTVITSTEGGSFSAINMYDRMVISCGILQWGEAGQYSVSDMIGAIVDQAGGFPKPFQTQLSNVDINFEKNAKGRWRFFFRDFRGEVDRLGEQKQLFLLRSNGLKGTWDEGSKEYAKSWAAAIASTLALPEAQKVQVAFTVPKLLSFITPEAHAILWEGSLTTDASAMSSGWIGALRSAYLSFAANLPMVASNQLKIAVAKSKAPKWSSDWCIDILKQLTFGPQITIYPVRYNGIRPVIERIYGVDLPDFAADLQAWSAKLGIDPTDSMPPFLTPKEIQMELIAEGYDLGPAGADGRIGVKTTDALFAFQAIHGLKVDGIIGPMTRKALLAEWQRRN